MKLRSLAPLLLFAATATAAMAAQPSGNPGVPWPAIDAQGGPLPLAAEARAPRADRTVAMFYFLWHTKWGCGGPHDVSKILAQDPDAMQKPDSPLWGPLQVPHHWGEPLFGYYLGDDEYILRKHAQMLADAGVDVIIFDTSNKATYPKVYRKLLEVFEAMRHEGNRTPAIAFLAPFFEPKETVNELYEQLYQKGVSKELWFQWEGKPLILADPAKVDPAVRDFFTFRTPQPSYFAGPTGPNMWSWLEVHPQHVFKNARGEKEEMSVGVAQNAVNGRLGAMSEKGAQGRSFHGDNYAEQWSHALAEDPRLVFITGWNEWIAGRFNEFEGVKEPVMFVDEFDQEHSRDIEPMKGGHGDRYYYETVRFVRSYKGVPAIPPIKPQPIRLDGNFADWQKVEPEFPDTVGDTVHRDHRGYESAGPYVNATGRNDIVCAKVSYDKARVYFYVRTREPLTPATDPNWMILLINTGKAPGKGWLGFDQIIRPGVTPDIPFKTSGNELELDIPRSMVGDRFDFKWIDAIAPGGDATCFTLEGDAAPNDRFVYRAEISGR